MDSKSQRKLYKAAYGVDFEKMNDEQIDKYAADLLIQRAKDFRYNNEQTYSPPKIPTTSKRLLLNTIKNTSSYNEFLKSQEHKTSKQTVSKKRKGRGMFSNIDAYRKDQPDKGNNEPSSSIYASMLQHSKFRRSKKSTIQPEEFQAIIKSVDAGTFGTVEQQKQNERLDNNQPNFSLPEKCPW